MGSVIIRPIVDAAGMDAVYRLTHEVYVREGYVERREDGRLIHYPHLDGIAETTVLGAYVDDVLVGTNSWTRDGPQGLHVDHDFRDEADAVRGNFAHWARPGASSPPRFPARCWRSSARPRWAWYRRG